MALLTSSEALHVSDCFLSSLYGTDTFNRWKALKQEMNFMTETDYVNWLIDIAYEYQACSFIDTTKSEATGDTENSVCLNMEESSLYEGTVSTSKTHNTRTMTTNISQSPVLMENSAYHSQSIDVKLEEGTLEATHTGGSEGQFLMESKATAACEENRVELLGDIANAAAADEILRSSEEEDNDNLGGPEDYGLKFQVGQDHKEEGWKHSSTAPAVMSRLGRASPSCKATRRTECLYCSYKSKHSANLSRHIASVHERKKPYACEHCRYACSQKINLERHLIFKHAYVAKYWCQKCGKRFPSPGTLRTHESTCDVIMAL